MSFTRTFAFSAAAMFIAFNAGCGFAPSSLKAPQRVGAAATVAGNGGGFAKIATKEEFAAAAKAKGVKLTEEDLAVIQAERTLVPTNVWAARPAEKLTAQQNLDVHFRKHGHEFRPAIESAEAYMAQGNAAATGKRGPVRFFFDTTSFKKGYQSHVVRWVPTTHDFTAFKANGEETTYYQNDPSPSRFIEVPTW